MIYGYIRVSTEVQNLENQKRAISENWNGLRLTLINLMTDFILYLWQLPQNLLGILSILLLQAYIPTFDSMPIIYTHTIKGLPGVSLGKYIIMYHYGYSERDILHEIGHQKQSKILGPLYLFVIGIPSVIGNILHRFIKFNYYSQPWEKWADKLGGVKR